jgi:hypothetical protein
MDEEFILEPVIDNNTKAFGRSQAKNMGFDPQATARNARYRVSKAEEGHTSGTSHTRA